MYAEKWFHFYRLFLHRKITGMSSAKGFLMSSFLKRKIWSLSRFTPARRMHWKRLRARQVKNGCIMERSEQLPTGRLKNFLESSRTRLMKFYPGAALL